MNPSRSKTRSVLTQVLKIAVSVGLIAFVLSKAGIERTYDALLQSEWWFIPVGMLIYLASQLISTYRWKFLCEAIGFRLPMRELYDYYLMGMFFSLVLPGSIGGDFSRMYYISRSANRRKREALLTVLAERGVGLVALLVMTTTVCLLPVTHIIPVWIRGLLITLSLSGFAGFLVLQVTPLDRLAGKFPKLALLQQAQVYWKNYGLLAKSVGISLFVHLAMVLVHLMVAHALHIEGIPFLYLCAVYGIVSLVSVLPIFFGGFGGREGTYVYLLGALYGLPHEKALAFAIYWTLISTLTSFVGGIVMMKGHYKAPPPEEKEQLESDAADAPAALAAPNLP